MEEFDRVVREIRGLPEVKGCSVYKNTGEPVKSCIDYSDKYVRKLGIEIKDFVDYVRNKELNIELIQYSFYNYKTVLVLLENGFLFILCDKDVPVSMLEFFKNVGRRMDRFIPEVEVEKVESKGIKGLCDFVINSAIDELSKYYGRELASTALDKLKKEVDALGDGLTDEHFETLILPVLKEKFKGIMDEKDVETWYREIRDKFESQ